MHKVKNISGGQVNIMPKGSLRHKIVLNKGDSHTFKDDKEYATYKDSILAYGTEVLELDRNTQKEVQEEAAVAKEEPAPVAAPEAAFEAGSEALVVGVGVKPLAPEVAEEAAPAEQEEKPAEQPEKKSKAKNK